MKYGKRSSRYSWKKFMASPLALIAVFILFVILARATWNIHAKAVVSAAKLAQAQTELAKLKERQADLSVKVDHLSTPEGLEAEVRTKYRAVKDGESVAVIVDDSETAAVGNASTTTATSTAPRGWWDRLLGFFGL